MKVLNYLFLFTLLCACQERTSSKDDLYIDVVYEQPKNCDELLKLLEEQGVDTLLIYKRTCISCCDFRTVFWLKDGRAFLQKVYDNSCDQRELIEPELTQRTPFDIARTHAEELRLNDIYGSKNREGILIAELPLSSHYCYSEIAIIVGRDTLFSGRMKDTDFQAIREAPNNHTQESESPHYASAIQSNWYALLVSVEELIRASDTTCEQEKEVMRKDTE